MWVLLTAIALGGDWPQFRGPHGNGVSPSGRIPSHWSSSNHLAWKVALPGSGWSQPVIIRRLVFLTAAIGGTAAGPRDYAAGLADP
jgi:hypothetical protein